MRTRIAVEQRREQLGGVHGADAGKIGDLVPARHAARDEHRSGRHAARGGQQPPLGNRFRDVVVVASIAERSRHAAAAGVEIDHRRAGDAAQKRLGRRHQAHRLLMTVAVQQDPDGRA